MALTSCTCGATWTGLRIEHCCSCHETFTGTTSGDRHRVGDHAVDTGPLRRRCLTADEMRAKGMAQNKRGQWTNGGTSPWAKEPVDPWCNECNPHPANESREPCSSHSSPSDRPGGVA